MDSAQPAAIAQGRRTRQLEATYDVVQVARDHPTAEQVHARVRRRIPRISLGTVYRNLQKLASAGRIRVVELGPGSTRFDGMLEAHEHFVCEGCGGITDLPASSQTPPNPASLRRAGFAVTRHALTFYGRCPACQEIESPGARRACR
jgi:Fe2+ or Zn2+ uptake regulation protein